MGVLILAESWDSTSQSVWRNDPNILDQRLLFGQPLAKAIAPVQITGKALASSETSPGTILARRAELQQASFASWLRRFFGLFRRAHMIQ